MDNAVLISAETHLTGLSILNRVPRYLASLYRSSGLASDLGVLALAELANNCALHQVMAMTTSKSIMPPLISGQAPPYPQNLPLQPWLCQHFRPA